MDVKEGSNPVIRYTKKSVAEDKLKKKKKNWYRYYGKGNGACYDFKNGKGKRKGKLGQLVCSSYVDRIIDVDEAVKDDENVVAQNIITWGKDKGEFIWETVDGHGMHLEVTQASYSRMYLTCDTITDCMVDEAVDEELRFSYQLLLMKVTT
ncbi:unnamed protein product [Lactuca saligna]|uniref:Uncharacterized protein n=1 Tax=Lactuca saligna TaxID=75948 RepID=A0AA35ZXB0_LACSI|nr:unnamed protein product [Lactuca saligna]